MSAWGRDVSASGRVGGSAFGKRAKLLVKMGVELAQEECSTFRKNVMSSAKHFRDLDVYQGAMSLVMRIFVEIAFRHGYLNQEVFNEVYDACDKILAQIVKMIDHADRWVIKARPDPPPHEDADTPTRRYADTSLLKPPGSASRA